MTFARLLGPGSRMRLFYARRGVTTARYTFVDTPVEIALKARICRTLKWNAYPSTASEFQKYQSFRTHDLAVLLHLSGRREKIKNEHLAAWSAVADWTPNRRYGVIGSTLAGAATEMLSSAKVLLRVL